MALTRNIDRDRIRRSIASSVIAVCRDPDIAVVAEGIETVGELDTIVALGVDLVQGHLLAKPVLEAREEPVWPVRFAAGFAPGPVTAGPDEGRPSRGLSAPRGSACRAGRWPCGCRNAGPRRGRCRA